MQHELSSSFTFFSCLLYSSKCEAILSLTYFGGMFSLLASTAEFLVTNKSGTLTVFTGLDLTRHVSYHESSTCGHADNIWNE